MAYFPLVKAIIYLLFFFGALILQAKASFNATSPSEVIPVDTSLLALPLRASILWAISKLQQF